MRSLRRRLLSVSVCVAVVGSWAVATPRHAAATTAGGCVINGSGVANPGVFLTQVFSEVYSFNGSMAPCAGISLFGGSLSGGMTCPADTIATCVPKGTFTLTGSPVGSCTGTMTHQGYDYSFTCGQLFQGSFHVAPNPLNVDNFETYTFTGTMQLAVP